MPYQMYRHVAHTYGHAHRRRRKVARLPPSSVPDPTQFDDLARLYQTYTVARSEASSINPPPPNAHIPRKGYAQRIADINEARLRNLEEMVATLTLRKPSSTPTSPLQKAPISTPPLTS